MKSGGSKASQRSLECARIMGTCLAFIGLLQLLTKSKARHLLLAFHNTWPNVVSYKGGGAADCFMEGKREIQKQIVCLLAIG